MRAVRLIDEERNAVPVRRRGDGGDVADDALVGRRRQNDQTKLRVRVQRRLDRLGRRREADPRPGVERRQKKDRAQPAQLDGVIDGSVRVARDEHGVAAAGQCPDPGEYAAARAIDEEI